MPLMGIRAYAAHRQCSHVAVLKAIKAGRIHAVGEGRDKKIDSEQADRDWIARTDPARQSVLPSAGPATSLPLLDDDDYEDTLDPESDGPPDTLPDAPPQQDTPADTDTQTYRTERARRETIRRQREQLALDQERKRLVDKAEVERLRFTEFRALRDALGNVGARIKDACAAERDALACEHLIDTEVAACLKAFADKVLVRGVTQDVDDEDEDPADAAH
jgi:hypothetical protein